MAKPGRKKHIQLRRIAVEIDCLEDHCGNCRNVQIAGMDISCVFFGVELLMDNDGRDVMRCSDCHLAERCANGENIR